MLDWIDGQSWSNGRVALWGVSYEGTSAFFTSLLRHPTVVGYIQAQLAARCLNAGRQPSCLRAVPCVLCCGVSRLRGCVLLVSAVLSFVEALDAQLPTETRGVKPRHRMRQTPRCTNVSRGFTTSVDFFADKYECSRQNLAMYMCELLKVKEIRHTHHHHIFLLFDVCSDLPRLDVTKSIHQVCCCPMFFFWDVYDDISHPGGVPMRYFSVSWQVRNRWMMGMRCFFSQQPLLCAPFCVVRTSPCSADAVCSCWHLYSPARVPGAAVPPI